MNILVTGGSSGLGRAIVEKTSSIEGNKVFFTYNSHVEEANAIVQNNKNIKAVHCDFCDDASVASFIAMIPSWSLDVLVNNAYVGNSQGKHFYEISTEEFMNSFRMNILPLISITQKVLETLRQKKGGKIITILTSSLFNLPPVGYALYASNKAYIHQLCKSWSKEYIRYGITSNCISPNFMQTELTKDTDERLVEQLIKGHPLKRLLTVQEVAECVLFFVNASNQINGVNMPLNAGMNIV
jgi:Dehydrogenases with different specificities (related to short-chain alcohol dehydrogenases)